MADQLDIYRKYFVDNKFERLGLFELLRGTYDIRSALYMGSFVHITPALVFKRTMFVDSDKRVNKFFDASEVKEFVETNRQYSEPADVLAFQQDYEKPIPNEREPFDLLISQYAGFVSQAGKKYLRKDGILVVNNSHGDASMAHLDQDYELVGVVNNTKDKWRFTDKSLTEYFIPKKGSHPTKAELQASMKGIGYTKSASNYIFRHHARSAS